MKIAIYCPNINKIGGVESWLYYIGRLYGEGRDITVYYVTGDEKQMDRLKQYIKVKRFYWQKIKCDIAIFIATTAPSEILCFEASKERIQFIHACYSVAYNTKKFIPSEYIDRYIAVSQTAANDYYSITGTMPEIMYNPVYIEKPRKVLKLISATRISRDKGSIWERMRIFAQKLIAADIPFIWLVFTNNTDIKPDVKNVVFMPSELKITDYIAEADYLVQFSKTEGDCLSIKESLLVGTPVLVTNFDAALENGVVDGKTGYIFDMNMTNIDVNKIYNKIPKFEYKLNSSDKSWNKLLGPRNKKKIVESDVCKVKCIKMEGFKDPATGKRRKYEEVWTCSQEDAEYLITYNNPNSFTNGPLVDIIE